MEVGVLLVSLALVFITSLLIAALGTGAFFSLLSISAVLGAILFYARDTKLPLRKLLARR
jgi:hypothetical protein